MPDTPPTGGSAGSAPVRVVIADDHGPMRALLSELLTSSGCVVVGEAADGRAAVEVVDHTDCDLVVMDYRMPIMNGLDAIERIVAGHPDLHVVAFSSDGDRALVDGLLAAGARAHFVKDDVDGLVRHVTSASRAA